MRKGYIMELYGRIGTMVITSTDRHIIGASDKENEDFRKKGQNIIKSNQSHQKDTVELSCIKEMDLKSETYENYGKTGKMPNHCFGDNYGVKLQNSIHTAVQAYCKGEMTEGQIQKAFMDACKDMRVYQAQCGHTTGVNADDNRQIIGNVYEIFQKSNVGYMAYQNFKAGSAIAAANGGEEMNDWVYYDAKYYYESQHLRDLLQEAASKMASEWNTECIDFEKIEKESKFIIDGKMDFNCSWDFIANNRGICTMTLPETWQPQEDFSFFYQENKKKAVMGEAIALESQAGVCIIGLGSRKWTMDVPFNGTASLGKLEDHFNVRELFEKNFLSDEPNLFTYLERFEVYTRFYGHKKTVMGIW